MQTWTPYREFWFDANSADLKIDSLSMIQAIANYLKSNPTLEIGIDETLNPNGSETSNKVLTNRRVELISHALKNAGVSSERILVGTYGDSTRLRERRVEVLLRTIPSA